VWTGRDLDEGRVVAGARPVGWTLVAALAVVTVASARPASAQAIRGVVLDDQTGAPVAGAAISLVIGDSARRAIAADDAGRFLMPLPGGGRYALEVVRLGYKTARSQEILVELGDTLSVEFRVLPEAVLLRPLLVTANSSAGRNVFEKRREEWGRGIFLGPDQIDSIAPRLVGDVFRGMEKVQLRWGWAQLDNGGYGPVPRVSTYLGRGCLLYVLDRVPVRPAPWSGTNDWASYQLSGLMGPDIVAVEVYRYPGEVPPELRRYASRTLTLFTNAGIQKVDQDLCGLAILHTAAGW